ncbi:MAG: DNA repair protein RecN [Planctomycetota bacterium]|jgi:DNA repair protein RecN (Recombination protein N)
MLKRLRIQHLAVVEDVTLEFVEGLNVLTGSTGAGKSLILGAVNILLGERTPASAIRQGHDTAVVEGEFMLAAPLAAVLSATLMTNSDTGSASRAAAPTGRGSQARATTRDSSHARAATGGGEHHRITLRREIRSNGRSQAYVQGKACTLKQLQAISRTLIEPHGQNEQLHLRDDEQHIHYIDRIADNTKQRHAYEGALEGFRTSEKALRDFERRLREAKEKRELLEHRIGEIAGASLTPGELAQLESALRVMENANDIYEALGGACESLEDGESAAGESVARARRGVERVANVDDRLKQFLNSIEEADIILRDVTSDIRAYLDRLEFDPDRLREMQDRVGLLQSLERRYAMPIDDLIAAAEEWQREIDSVSCEHEERAKHETERAKALTAAVAAAETLTTTRNNAAKKLDRALTKQLTELLMPGAHFRTEIVPESDPAGEIVRGDERVRFRADGIDRVRFLVRTNTGEPEGALSEIASSGELSRIALGLKKATSVGREGSVLVFDELDAGVGADLGDMLSGKLAELATNYQIICITHMPQIAAAGAQHASVRKRTEGGRTSTYVVEVDGDDRLKELARMLGGSEGSDNRLALAAEMLDGMRATREGDSARKAPRARG